MSDTPTNPAPDPTWDSFNQSEAERDADLEKRFQEVEAVNTQRLNQIVRLEDSGLKLAGQISDNHDAVAPDLISIPTNGVKLFLRPDREKELFEQGEPDDTVIREGDPFTIIGDVPPRVQQLIDNLLTGVEAVPNPNKSNTTEEVWDGNIAGQPLEIVAIHADRVIYLPDSETHEPTLSLMAFHPDARSPDPK